MPDTSPITRGTLKSFINYLGQTLAVAISATAIVVAVTRPIIMEWVAEYDGKIISQLEDQSNRLIRLEQLATSSERRESDAHQELNRDRTELLELLRRIEERVEYLYRSQINKKG